MLSDMQSMRIFNGLFASSQLCGALAFLLVVVWMVGYEDGYSWISYPEKQFHYHPTLMIMGLLFVTGEAIVVFRVLRKEAKRTTKLIHVTLHSVTLIFVLVSLKAVWDSHDYHRKASGELDPLPNLFSLHSWIGIALVIIYFIQYAVGFVAFLYPGLNNSTRMMLMPYHRLFGFLIFFFVAVTILMGITEFSAWHHKCWVVERIFCAEQGIANFIGIFVLLYVGLILTMVLNPRWRRKPLPEESSLREEEEIDNY